MPVEEPARVHHLSPAFPASPFTAGLAWLAIVALRIASRATPGD